MTTTTNTPKQKKPLPKPGKRQSARKAMAATNKQYAAALAKLAK